MQITIEYKPDSLEETKEMNVFDKYDTKKTYWNIPGRFKQQVFDFLESLATRSNSECVREKEEETVDGEESHIEALIKESTVSNTLKKISALKSFNGILQDLYDTAYENGKQAR